MVLLGALIWLSVFGIGLFLMPSDEALYKWGAINVLAVFLVGTVSDEWEKGKASKTVMKAKQANDETAPKAARVEFIAEDNTGASVRLRKR